jgi:hypothetical protein
LGAGGFTPADQNLAICGRGIFKGGIRNMEQKKCPIANSNCCKTECAWFIESNDNEGQKELNGCSVKLLALAKWFDVNKTSHTEWATDNR